MASDGKIQTLDRAVVRRLATFSMGVLLFAAPLNGDLAAWLEWNGITRAVVATAGLLLAGWAVAAGHSGRIPDPPTPTRARRVFLFTTTAVVSAAIVFVPGVWSTQDARPLPAEYRTPLLARLAACTNSSSAGPAGCPQSVDGLVTEGPVVWQLHGDPLEGAIYHPVLFPGNRSGWIEGTAVMTAAYPNLASPYARQVLKVRYLADIGKPDSRHRVDIRLRSTEDRTSVVKGRPAISDTGVQQAVYAARLSCAQHTCVDEEFSAGNSAESIAMRYAWVTFDPEFGLFTVKASFIYKIEWPDATDCKQQVDAHLILEDKTPVVLGADGDTPYQHYCEPTKEMPVAR